MALENPILPDEFSDVIDAHRPQVFFWQARALTIANLKTRYRKTVAGFVWVVLSPLIIYGTQSYVFHTILKLQVNQYHLFLLSGLLPWIFISQSLEMCTTIYTTSARLLKSFPLHPLVYLLAQILDNLVNFSSVFLIILVPAILFSNFNPIGLLLLPIPMAFLFVWVFSTAWILAIAQVFLRDTRFILTFALNILYFLTPIFYPIEFVPEKYRWVIAVNPINYIIRPFRLVIYSPEFNLVDFIQACAVSGAISFVFFGLSIMIWKKTRNRVFFHL